MKLIVPFIGEVDPNDARLVRIANTMGIEHEYLALQADCLNPAEFLRKAGGSAVDCLAINCTVLGRWLKTDAISSDVSNALATSFKVLLVHVVELTPFCAQVLQTLSAGRIQALKAIANPGAGYAIRQESQDICGYFSGLTFGIADEKRDQVMVVADASGVDPLITIEGLPLFARFKLLNADVYAVSCLSIANIDLDITRAKLSDFFSGLLPIAMTFRAAFGDTCWQPSEPRATMIIDDPPLWRRYGFLNYEALMRMMDTRNFHTSIAFIPYYYQKSRKSIVQMFRNRRDRISMCYHGNDHTAGEMASEDSKALDSLLTTAVARMDVHARRTDIECDKVMVFPQGRFSRQGMAALKTQNFAASINSGHVPVQDYVPLTIAESMAPAVLKYSDFPLFLRKYPNEFTPENIAYDVFFGRPLFIVEHHDGFEDPSPILQAVDLINRVVPGVGWVAVHHAIREAYLIRRCVDLYVVRSFSSNGFVINPSNEKRSYRIEWQNSSNTEVRAVLVDGKEQNNWKKQADMIQITFEVEPGQLRSFAVVYSSHIDPQYTHRNLTYSMKVHVRRRLCEYRDNYLSRSAKALAIAKFMHARLKKLRISNANP